MSDMQPILKTLPRPGVFPAITLETDWRDFFIVHWGLGIADPMILTSWHALHIDVAALAKAHGRASIEAALHIPLARIGLGRYKDRAGRLFQMPSERTESPLRASCELPCPNIIGAANYRYGVAGWEYLSVAARRWLPAPAWLDGRPDPHASEPS